MNGQDEVPLGIETKIRERVVQETTAAQQREHLAIATAPTALETCLTVDALKASLSAFPSNIVEATLKRYFPDRVPEDALVREGKALVGTLEKKAEQLEESLISVLNGIMASKQENFDIKLSSNQERSYYSSFRNYLIFNLIGYETHFKNYKLSIKSITSVLNRTEKPLFEIEMKYVPKKWYTQKEKREIRIRVNLELISNNSTDDCMSDYYTPHQLLKHISENIAQYYRYQDILDELAVLPSLVGDYLKSRVRRVEGIEFKKVE